MDQREGWGWHDMESWQAFFDVLHEIGQISEPVQAEDVLTNELIGPANDFDHEKVKADAEAYELSEEMQAVDVETIRAGLFDAAI